MIRSLQNAGQLTKIILAGVLLIICGSMVITLIPGGLTSDIWGGNPGKGIVAKVGGSDITAEEVRQTARQMLQQQMPQGSSANMSLLLPFFAQRAADQLITRQALITQAERMGLRVTPNEVQDELQHGRYAATFFRGGSFIGQQEYEEMLTRANLTVASFEENVGKDILLTKLQALIVGGATVSESEVREQFIKQNTKVKFEYAVLKQEDLRKGLHPTEEELRAFYDSHKNTYVNAIPEKRKIKYVVFDLSKVEGSVPLSRAEVQAYYDSHRDQYRVPEQVKVSHILIKTPAPGPDGKADEKGVTEAQHRAEDLLKQLKSGAKLEDLAKKYSEDPGSAKQGGSLGSIGKGQTVPEFEKAAFSLPKGQISDLVKSSYGFHIIRVDDKQEAHLKPLDEVKGEIEPILRKQKATQTAQKQAESLLNQARSAGFDAAAAAQGSNPITSDFYGRRELLPGLGTTSTQLNDAVFNLPDKSPPQMATTSQAFIVFQLLGIKPASTPTFEEIHSRVEDEFKNERSNVLLSQKSSELSDRAKASHDLKKAAKELGATVKTSDFVAPDGQVPEIGSMAGQAAVAFTMKPGEISGPIVSGSNGAVLSLLESQQPTDADFAARRDQIRDALLQGKQQELFELFVSNLRDQMEKAGKIKINQEEMKTLTRTGAESGL